jgi:hypothetical protein
VRVADVWYEGYRRRVGNFERRLGGEGKVPGAPKRPPTFFGALRTFVWYVRDDFSRGRRVRFLKRQLQKTVHGRGTRPVRLEATKLALRLAMLERHRVLLPRLEPLFAQWKAAHIPMSIVLTIVATLHIVIELRR